MTNAQITIREKKLGLLIRDARLAERRTIKECADAIGVKPGIFRAYEEGRRAPSLPELEALVYFLKVSIFQFWGDETISDLSPTLEANDIVRLIELRHRMIGAMVRQERTNKNISPRQIASDTGISQSRLKAYELGEKPISVPELEMILNVIGVPIESFFDQSGPVGQWLNSNVPHKKFNELPEDIQIFVSQPVNRPYIELAMKLSSMSREKLRSVAEGLLDITL
ncbi:MAG: Xre family DNA-binding protein [Chloroflexi bacterium OLB14]|nr:MAG: Xre family DNA-binding protein [Chloroflexi bacterium OLB14]